MITSIFLDSVNALYNDTDLAWLQTLLLNSGYIGDPTTGDPTFQLEQSVVAGHSLIVKSGYLVASITKGGKTWKLIIKNDADLTLSVPQNTSGVTKYVHIVVKIDNSVVPNAAKSNVATIVAVSLTTSTPSTGDIQAVIGAGMDFYSLGYVTQVDFNPALTNSLITNQSTKVIMTQAVDLYGVMTELDSSNAAVIVGSTISFTTSTKTIADSANGFITAGFRAGQQITVTGSSSNNGTYTIRTVTAGAIVVRQSTLVNESAGASVSITNVKANKLLRLDSNGKLPAFDGSQLTNISISLSGLTAGETLTAGRAGYLGQNDGKVYHAHGRKASASNGVGLPTNDFYEWIRLNSTQFMWLGYSSNTLTLAVLDKTSGSTIATQTVSTTFQSGSHTNTAPRAGVARLTDTTFVVFYTKTGSSTDKLYFRTGTISGATITMDTETVYPSSPDYVYNVVVANGSGNGKVALSFMSQSGGIGSNSTLNCYLKALTVATNSVTENYSSNYSVGSGSFWPSGAWNIIGATASGLYFNMGHYMDSGGTYACQGNWIDMNTGDSGTSYFNPIPSAQGASAIATDRPTVVVHDDSMFFGYDSREAMTGGAIRCIWLAQFNTLGVTVRVVRANNNRESSPGDANTSLKLVGGYHGFYIPDNEDGMWYSKGNLVPFRPVSLEKLTVNNRYYMNGTNEDEAVWYYGNSTRCRAEYWPTAFDGMVATSVAALGTTSLYRASATGLSLTAFRDYYLKDSYTNAGELATRGIVRVGKSYSSSDLLIKTTQ